MDSEMLVNAEKRVFLFTVNVSLETDGTRRGNMKKTVSCATLILYNLTLITLDTIKIVNPYQSINEYINQSVYQLINHSLTYSIN